MDSCGKLSSHCPTWTAMLPMRRLDESHVLLNLASARDKVLQLLIQQIQGSFLVGIVLGQLAFLRQELFPGCFQSLSLLELELQSCQHVAVWILRCVGDLDFFGGWWWWRLLFRFGGCFTFLALAF